MKHIIYPHKCIKHINNNKYLYNILKKENKNYRKIRK